MHVCHWIAAPARSAAKVHEQADHQQQQAAGTVAFSHPEPVFLLGGIGREEGQEQSDQCNDQADRCKYRQQQPYFAQFASAGGPPMLRCLFSSLI